MRPQATATVSTRSSSRVGESSANAREDKLFRRRCPASTVFLLPFLDDRCRSYRLDLKRRAKECTQVPQMLDTVAKDEPESMSRVRTEQTDVTPRQHSQERIKWSRHRRFPDILASEHKHQRYKPLPSPIHATSATNFIEQFASSLNAEVFW